MSLQLLLFDLDETLAPDVETNFAIFREMFGNSSTRDDAQTDGLLAEFRGLIRGLWRAGPAYVYCARLGISAWEGLWGPFGMSEHPMLAALHVFVPTYRATAWERFVKLPGAPSGARAGELEERFLQARQAAQRAYPWSAAVLDDVAAHYRLGVITNGAPDLQRLKLEGTGLAERFELVVVSGDLDVGKPEAAIFDYALRQTGVDASGALMIGDSWERDMAGALGVGMCGVWVNPRRVPLPTDAPDAAIQTIRDLRELPATLAAGA